MNNYSKKLSQLISDLENILDEYGDMYVAVGSLENELLSTALEYEILSYNYEEICCYPKKPYTEDHSKEWGVVSKNKNELGPVYLHITCDSPDLIVGGDTVENVKLPKTSYNDEKKVDNNTILEIEKLRELFEKIAKSDL